MNKRIVAAVAAGVLMLGLAGCGVSEGGSSSSEYPGGTYKGEKTACLVTDKAAMQKADGDGGSTTDYRIYTSCGVFGVQDDPFIGQWNSADTYGSIQVDRTYDFEAYGWRNGFLSTFPNIKQAFPVEAAVSE